MNFSCPNSPIAESNSLQALHHQILMMQSNSSDLMMQDLHHHLQAAKHDAHDATEILQLDRQNAVPCPQAAALSLTETAAWFQVGLAVAQRNDWSPHPSLPGGYGLLLMYSS